jgi:hypothetical protein
MRVIVELFAFTFQLLTITYLSGSLQHCGSIEKEIATLVV